MAQIIWSTRHLVKVLLGIQQKFYQTSSRAIFLLLDVQQIFTPSKRRLVGSYFSATRHLIENFYQPSSTKSSTTCLVEQKIWANSVETTKTISHLGGFSPIFVRFDAVCMLFFFFLHHLACSWKMSAWNDLEDVLSVAYYQVGTQYNTAFHIGPKYQVQ